MKRFLLRAGLGLAVACSGATYLERTARAAGCCGDAAGFAEWFCCTELGGGMSNFDCNSSDAPGDESCVSDFTCYDNGC